MLTQEHQTNEAAFRRSEESIAQTYPHGQVVAFVGGEIVADADGFDKLHALLRAAGKDPVRAFIILAGHVYLENAIIFAGTGM
jgi:hypothetical protein